MILVTSVSTAGLFYSCNREKGPEFLDLDMANITMLTPGQQAIFDEATKRMDKQMSFDADAGQFVLATGASAAIFGLSDRLFDYFKINITTTNNQFRFIREQGLELVEVSRNMIKIFDPKDGFDFPTKMADEFEEGGITKTETTWWGYRTYLSNWQLRNIRSTSELTTIMCGTASATPAAPFAIPIGTLTAITAWIAGGAADNNPNGVIVNIPQFGAPSYVPQSALPR